MSQLNFISTEEIPKNENTNILPENAMNQDINTNPLSALKSLPNRLLSPNTKRMENIKNEILKVTKSSANLECLDPIHTRDIPEKIPEISLQGKTRLEALLSPRTKKRSLPRLTSDNLKNQLRDIPVNTAMSPRREALSKMSQLSTFSSPFYSRTNQVLKNKLSYEWKNIYRSLNTIDLNSSGLVTKKEFEN